MPVHFTSPIGTHLWFSFFVIACLEGLAIHTWQFRKEPGARWQTYSIVCKGGWLLALVLAQISTGTAQHLFWISLYQMLAFLLSFIWFRFIAQISGFERGTPKWITNIPGGFVAFIWLVILTNGWHGWYWRSAWMTGTELWMVAGPVIPWARNAAYLMNAFTVAINIRWVFCSAGLRRRQAAWFLLPSLIVWFGHFMTLLPGLKTLAPLPSAFLLSSILAVWAYQRWLMYGLLSLAEDTVVKIMIDGLMVVDETDFIVEMNSTAKSIFQGLPVAEGGLFKSAAEAWPALADSCSDKNAATFEVSREIAGSPRTYEVTLTPLRTWTGYQIGRVLVFKDVTLKKDQQARIVEQQKALSQFEERARLGRELHDGPGQLCGYLSMQTQAARILMSKHKYEQADQRLEQLQQTVQGMFVGLRESISGLQTSVTGDRGLLNALHDQLLWYREHCGLRTELDLRCAWQAKMLSPGTEVQLLRILQEALANVRKSAQASQIRIVIERQDDHLIFVVEDDGCGFDSSQPSQQTGHHGLQIMGQRAEEIGAQITVVSNPGSGTRVELCVPVALNLSENSESLP
jgi:signal transduction histidine kinase